MDPFDVVVLDLTIKGGKGVEPALRELLKIDPDVKAIVVSGHFGDPVMENFQDYGFKAAMAKPYRLISTERSEEGNSKGSSLILKGNRWTDQEGEVYYYAYVLAKIGPGLL